MHKIERLYQNEQGAYRDVIRSTATREEIDAHILRTYHEGFDSLMDFPGVVEDSYVEQETVETYDPNGNEEILDSDFIVSDFSLSPR